MGDSQCIGGCRSGCDIWFWVAILILIWCHCDGGIGFGKY